MPRDGCPVYIYTSHGDRAMFCSVYIYSVYAECARSFVKSAANKRSLSDRKADTAAELAQRV